VKEQALQELYRRIQGWQQQAQDLSQRKQQELLAPVYDKVKKAIADVAKENGFTFIFNKEQLLVSPPGDDILPLVKKKLNIK
jgi:outer membrane protein